MAPRLVPLVSAAIAIVLQIVVAPLISFSSVVPNFLVALVLVLSIVRRADTTYVYAFVLGLLSDLLSQTPVGLTPLLLLIASFALSRAFEVMDKTSYSMPLIACLVSVLLYELLIAIVLLLLGYQAGFFDLLLYRVFPGALYNLVFCALFFVLSRKFSFGDDTADVWSVSRSDRFR